MRRVLVVMVAVAACGGVRDVDGGVDALAGVFDLASSPSQPDPCGATWNDGGNVYSCAYLVGSCPSPGLWCECWERGAMVCQRDRMWELVLDDGCPELLGRSSYQGIGCLHARDNCGGCTCDAQTSTYQCPVDGGATD